MKTDFSPLGHAGMAAFVQCLIGLSTGEWVMGGFIGCTWFIAREHTQAEYRWIANIGKGKRENMPWWGGFDCRAWDMASLLDWAVPVLACSIIYALIR